MSQCLCVSSISARNPHENTLLSPQTLSNEVKTFPSLNETCFPNADEKNITTLIRMTGWYIKIFIVCTKNIEKHGPLKEAQHDKIENVADSVWLSLFIDGSGKCELPSTPTSTGLSRIQHLKMFIAGNYEFKASADVFIWWLSRNVTQSATQWQVAYDPKYILAYHILVDTLSYVWEINHLH